ncbi:MAG: hypothetical protein JO002_11650 [Burkholderiaceae bacterium]|nr:hypothetical protein [Burkholderiaceae bacterium]
MADGNDQNRLDNGLVRLFGVGPGQAGVHLDAIRAKAAGNLAAYGKVLSELFTRQATPIAPPVHLQWWSEGSRIRVVGDHKDRERLEVILNGDGEIVEEFKELELLHEIVRSAEAMGQTNAGGQHFNIGITSIGPIAFFSE